MQPTSIWMSQRLNNVIHKIPDATSTFYVFSFFSSSNLILYNMPSEFDDKEKELRKSIRLTTTVIQRKQSRDKSPTMMVLSQSKGIYECPAAYSGRRQPPSHKHSFQVYITTHTFIRRQRRKAPGAYLTCDLRLCWRNHICYNISLAHKDVCAIMWICCGCILEEMERWIWTMYGYIYMDIVCEVWKSRQGSFEWTKPE